MKIKYLIGAMIVIFGLYMGSVFVYGFVQKQQKESNLSETTPSIAPANPPANSEQPTTSTVPSQKTFTQSEVALHNKPNDCWLIISNNVYDVGRFLDLHPGGFDLIIPFCGKDATQAFNTQGGRRSNHSQNARNLLQQYLLGVVQ